MATMISEVYDAFRKAGTPDAEARKAAEALAAYDPRLARIEGDVGTLKGDVGTLKADVAVLKGMVGFALAMLVAILLRLFLQ